MTWETVSHASATHVLQADHPAKEGRLRRTFKDSVFTSLFSDPRYVYELYQGLHPEDAHTTVDDIQTVTVQSVLAVDEHNDLGFVVGDTLLVLVEAQSTWSPNIALRALLYAAQTIKNLVHERELNVYGTAPVHLPQPELYVIYTGRREGVPSTVGLSEALFGGRQVGIESRVKVISDPGPTMAGQYIDFARTMDAWRTQFGPSEEAIRAALAECKAKGVLTDYLADHEKEVVSIMMTLYDDEEVLHNYVADERRQAIAEGLAEGRAEGRAQGIVETCKSLGASLAATVDRVESSLGLDRAAAEAVVSTYW